MKINKMFFLPAIILIAGFNCIYGKNPKTGHSNPAPDAIETMFQKIKDDVSDIKNKIYLILKYISCIPDSDLKKSFFKTSLTNYMQINLNNNHNNNHINESIDAHLNDEYLKKITLKKITDTVKKLCQENLKQRTEFDAYQQYFLNHGIQTDQTDRDLFVNGVVLSQLAIDCTHCTDHQKHLSKKHNDKYTEK